MRLETKSGLLRQTWIREKKLSNHALLLFWALPEI
jgi:hypothetical protein